ncbi:DUF6481 family protein [Siccirubricoccus deserti]|nr:DUF6481 family protein [Siccirubricoccus deserti]
MATLTCGAITRIGVCHAHSILVILRFRRYQARMSAHKHDDFANRLTTAANAKKALLERFRSRPGPDDPEVIARREERLAVAAAREIRMAEQRAARQAAAAREAAERAALAAEAEARAKAEAARLAEEAERAMGVEADKKARALALAAEQKALRDARYAARKARRR